MRAEIRSCFRRMRRAYRVPAGRPYIGLTPFLREELLARPAQEMKCASWFFRPRPLLSGLAMPEMPSSHARKLKSDGSKIGLAIALSPDICYL